MRRLILGLTALGAAALMVSPDAIAGDVYLTCAAEPTDMSLSPGDIVSCEIAPIADSDLFRFEGVAGSTVVLTLTDATAFGAHPLAQIFDPDQQLISSIGIDDGGARERRVLEKTGTYTVLVTENGDDQTATYALGLQGLFPPSVEAVQLCYDCVHTDAIDVLADSDVYLFDGAVGTTIMLTLTDAAPFGAHPFAQVFDPDEQLVDSLGVNDSGDRHILELQKTGAYTVLVTDAGDDQTAGYFLGLQGIFPIWDSVECLDYGSVRSDQIDPLADSDLLRFTGTSGTTVRLTLTDTTPFGACPIAEFLDPAHTLISTLTQDDGAAVWQGLLTSTGDYLVVIRENGDDQTATYNVALECVFGGCSPCPSAATQAGSWGATKARYR